MLAKEEHFVPITSDQECEKTFKEIIEPEKKMSSIWEKLKKLEEEQKKYVEFNREKEAKKTIFFNLKNKEVKIAELIFFSLHCYLEQLYNELDETKSTEKLESILLDCQSKFNRAEIEFDKEKTKKNENAVKGFNLDSVIKNALKL